MKIATKEQPVPESEPTGSDLDRTDQASFEHVGDGDGMHLDGGGSRSRSRSRRKYRIVVVVLVLAVVGLVGLFVKEKSQLRQAKREVERLEGLVSNLRQFFKPTHDKQPSQTPTTPSIQNLSPSTPSTPKTQPPTPIPDITKTILNTLTYEQLKFKYNKNLQTTKELTRLIDRDVAKYAKELGLGEQDYWEKLAIGLAGNFEEGKGRKRDERFEDLEYYYADRKYNIGKIKQELPICIFIESDPSITLSQLDRQILSLQSQNYTNFHIIYIDQPPTPSSSSSITPSPPQTDLHKHLLQTSTPLKNKLSILKPSERQPTTASIFFGVRKYCKQEDIVLLVGKGSVLLGRQGLKIVNAVYRDEKGKGVWFVGAAVLARRSQYDLVSSWRREVEEDVLADVRYARKLGQIRSFRKSAIDLIPIENLIPQKHNNQTNISTLFHHTTPNTFALYAYPQESIESKTLQLPDYLFLSLRLQENCEEVHKKFVKALRGEKKANTTAQERVLKQCVQRYREKIDFHLRNPVKIVYGEDQVYKRTVYNEKAVSTPIGQHGKYVINLKDHIADISKIRNDWRSFKSGQVKTHNDVFYVLTPHDFQPIIRAKSIDFQAWNRQIERDIPFQVLEFEYDSNISMEPKQMKFEKLKTEKQAEQFLNTGLKKLNKNVPFPQDTAYQLAYQMQTNPLLPQIAQSQYHYTNKRLNNSLQTNPIQNQLPICIISTSYNLFHRQNGDLYRRYFQHMQLLNYTNYHVVYIDDHSTDDSLMQIYNYVKGSSMRIKNRMKIVHNLRNLGVTANLYYWPLKLCGEDEIVVLIDADDNVLGRQTLKVFSYHYSNPETWYVFTRHLKWLNGMWNRRGDTFGEKNIFVRRERIWTVANTRTFRASLHRKVPFFQVIELHYETTNFTAWPIFQDLSADGIQVCNQIELAGNNRTVYYDGLTYGYSGATFLQRCYENIELYDWRKTMSRTRLQTLQSFNDTARLRDDDQFPTKLYEEAIEVTKLLLRLGCVKK